MAAGVLRSNILPIAKWSQCCDMSHKRGCLHPVCIYIYEFNITYCMYIYIYTYNYIYIYYKASSTKLGNDYPWRQPWCKQLTVGMTDYTQVNQWGLKRGSKSDVISSHFVWRLWCRGIMRRMSRLFVGVRCFAMTQLRRAEWRLKYHNTYMWLTLSSLSMSNVSGSSTNPLTRPLSPCFLQASDLTDVEREHDKKPQPWHHMTPNQGNT